MAKKKKSAARNDDSQPSFEEALKELEETVRLLEDGQLGLGESLARYEEGVQHLQRCQQLLRRAERKIELLSGVDAEGNPVTKPFDDGDLSLEEKADTRTKRRSSTQTAAKQEDSGDIDEGSRLF
jgi:exodeoxyribonuclease VII small subunit